MSQARIGIAGLGTVGAATVKILSEKRHDNRSALHGDLHVTAVNARDKTKDRGIDLDEFTWFDDPVALASSDEIDIFVELIGGSEDPALAAVKEALSSGKHVVTANKALLSHHGNELAKLAEENGVSLNYEAAVAGGIPIIKSIREALVGNEITKVYGILNGTCNYILTRMEQDSLSFDACLKDAQELGYAEADPTFDIEGFDAAHKLSILTSLCFGSEIAFLDSGERNIFVEGISRISLEDINAANALGYKIKLLGVAQKTSSGIEQRVHPTMVPRDTSIARIDGVLNAVAVEGDHIGQLMLVGPGAGGEATASAVIADLNDIACGTVRPTLGLRAGELKSFERARMQAHEGGYYIRLHVIDEIGAFAAIAQRMSEQNISLESIVQHQLVRRKADIQEPADDNMQPVIMITHQTTEKQVKDALESIMADGYIKDDPQMIRIEHF